MKFINKGETTQVRIEVNGEYQWVLLKTGREIDIPEQQGINYGFEKVTNSIQKVTEGKIGEIKVETKQFNESDFFNELKNINGVGKKTAKDIIKIFPTKEELIKEIATGNYLPFRDDVELKLRKKYG